MSEYNRDQDFEKNIVEAFAIPAISEEFVNSQYEKIAAKKEMRERKGFFSKPIMLRFSTATLALLMGATLIIGPQKVYAAIMRLFGYIPGVGVVSEDTDIRILEEPVSVTRDGITVSVNSMVLTPNETLVDFGTMGVPSWANANEGMERGCFEFPYLLLADGTEIDVVGKEAVPADVWEATFVVPCIMGAYTDQIPTDWQIPVVFVPAPDDYVVLPVYDVSPEVTEKPLSNNETNQTEEPVESIVNLSINKMIETETGYILVGKLSPAASVDQIQQMGISGVYDANGNQISTTYPNDVNEYELVETKPGDMTFAFAFAGNGVAFPIRVEISGVVVTFLQTEEKKTLPVTIPEEMQDGETLNVNQSIMMDGYELMLKSIIKGPNGYKFTFQVPEGVVGVSVNIADSVSMGGGGSWVVDGEVTRSLVYEQLPSGDVTLEVWNLQIAGEAQTWKTEWQPEQTREFVDVVLPDDLCWHVDMGTAIPVLADQLQGDVLVTQYAEQSQIVISSLQGEMIKTISNASQPSFSLDGQRIAYQLENAVIIQNLNSGEEMRYEGFNTRDITWSPDGKQIAFVNNGDHSGIFFLDLETGDSRQMTDYGYEYIAGWSVDETTLYYAIPGASEDGFPLFALDVDTGESTQLFILEDSSLKAPYPRVSPDGQWIVYRDRDNGSMYLKNMDGSEARLVMDKPGVAIGNLNWSANGDWLVLNVFGGDMSKPDVVLIDPFGCVLYKVPELWGYVNGVIVE